MRSEKIKDYGLRGRDYGLWGMRKESEEIMDYGIWGMDYERSEE